MVTEPQPGTVQAVVEINVQPFLDALARFAEGVKRMMPKFQAFATAYSAALHQRDEVWLAGQEGRYYVRGGLDPAYADSPDALVRELLALPGMTRRNRARMAAAALHGWVEHQDTAAPGPLAWHRLLGSTVVRVGVAR